MLNRIETETAPLQLPNTWTDTFKQSLLNIYGDKCLQDERTFEIYAFTFPEEALLITSYVGLDQYTSPVTLFLSADLKNNEKPEKTLDILCDSVGVFFDHYFGFRGKEDEIFDDYVFEWQEEDFSGIKVFHKITRENVGLTLEANRLLGEGF